MSMSTRSKKAKLGQSPGLVVSHRNGTTYHLGRVVDSRKVCCSWI